MSIEEQVDMHEETQRVIRALFEATVPEPATAFDPEASLARFACGWATPEEADQVIEALIASSPLRNRLVEMRQRLLEAESSVEARVRVFEQEPVLGAAMKSALSGCVKLFANWNESCRAGARHKLDREGQRSLGAALRQLSRRLSDNVAVPAFALTRGAAHAKNILVEPGELRADLTVEVDQDESFRAHATLSQRPQEGKELSLYLVEPNGGWVWLGCNTVIGDQWMLDGGGFSALCNIPVEKITMENFAMAEGRFFQPRNWIPVWVSDQLRRSRHIAPPGKLRSLKGPSIQGQQLHVEMEFPEALRLALNDAQMVMSVDLGATSFVVGSWPVAQLPKSKEIVVDAHLPGIPDCQLEYQSAVTLMFR